MAGSGSTSPALSRNDLVVERAQVHAKLLPLCNVVGKGDGAAGAALALAHRDVLVEGGGALDGWLVDLLVLVDGVCRAIACECALHSALASAATRGAVLDVVLDQRVRAPAVEGDEGGAGGGGCRASVGDDSTRWLGQCE